MNKLLGLGAGEKQVEDLIDAFLKFYCFLEFRENVSILLTSQQLDKPHGVAVCLLSDHSNTRTAFMNVGQNCSE